MFDFIPKIWGIYFKYNYQDNVSNYIYGPPNNPSAGGDLLWFYPYNTPFSYRDNFNIISYSNNTVTWYSTNYNYAALFQRNVSGHYYFYIAIG